MGVAAPFYSTVQDGIAQSCLRFGMHVKRSEIAHHACYAHGEISNFGYLRSRK